MTQRAEGLGKAVLLAPVALGLEDRDERRVALGAHGLQHAVLLAHGALAGGRCRSSCGLLARGVSTATTPGQRRREQEQERRDDPPHATLPSAAAARSSARGGRCGTATRASRAPRTSRPWP